MEKVKCHFTSPPKCKSQWDKCMQTGKCALLTICGEQIKFLKKLNYWIQADSSCV